jgi:hypothetical protein
MKRYIKLDDADQELPLDAPTWSQVYMPDFGLVRAADPLPARMAWKAANENAAEFRLGGHTTWRAPSIEEELLLVDYTRFDPAFDPRFFRGEAGFYWTSTPLASAPRDYAHYVSFDGGGADDSHQHHTAWVRPCRSVSAARQ